MTIGSSLATTSGSFVDGGCSSSAPLVVVTALAAALNIRQPDTFSSGARVLLNANAASTVLDGGTVNAGIADRETENEIAFARVDAVEDNCGRTARGSSPKACRSAAPRVRTS